MIEDSDNLLLGCKTEDDVSYLEVYVYEEEEDNLYVHHDIMLPSFPLCLEWLDFHIGRKHDRQGAGKFQEEYSFRILVSCLTVTNFRKLCRHWNI